MPSYSRTTRPRDLRTAVELAERGYHDLGAPQACLEDEDDEALLYSTSEARRRRDPLWARPNLRAPGSASPSTVGHAPGETPAPEASPVAAPARVGRCRECGRAVAALAGELCTCCRRVQRDPVLHGVDTSSIARLFERGFVVLDTETTGLGRHDEIIEVGVVAADGATLLDTLVWPRSGRVPASARRVHGLGIGDLQGAPTWREVLPELRSVLADRRVLAWNAPFDERMARQSSRAWRIEHRLPAFECAMRAYALELGVPGGRRKLQVAAAEQGVGSTAQQHRSVDDARLTLAVLARLADRPHG